MFGFRFICLNVDTFDMGVVSVISSVEFATIKHHYIVHRTTRDISCNSISIGRLAFAITIGCSQTAFLEFYLVPNWNWHKFQ